MMDMSEEQKQQQLQHIRAMKCAVCKEGASFLCTTCCCVWYCSVEHREAHWKTHLHYCYPFEVKVDGKGQYLVATRDVEAGATLIVEEPLFRIPQRVKLSCFVCGEAMHRQEEPRYCSKCTWPVCSEKCEKMRIHAQYECNFFRVLGLKFDFNGSENYHLLVAAMRGYLAKSMEPDLWRDLTDLGLMEPEEKFQYIPEDLGAILRPLTKSIGLDDVEDAISDGSMILQLFARQGFTCIESKIAGYAPPLGKQCREAYLYKICSNLRHSCIPNCLVQMEHFPNRSMKLRAMRPIKAGEILTCTRFFSWADGTKERRETVYERYGYICECERCTDPTELNTFCSAIRCSICLNLDAKYKNNKLKKGTSMLKKTLIGQQKQQQQREDDENSGYLLPADPQSVGSNIMLKCNRCSSIVFYSEVSAKMQHLTLTLRENDPQCNPHIDFDLAEKICLDLIEQNRGCFLHKNHYLIQIAVRILVNDIQYPRMVFGLDGCASMKEMNEYIKNCEYLMKIQDRVRPGFSTFKDELMYSIFEAKKRKLYFPISKTKEKALEELTFLINAAETLIKFHKNSPCEPGEKMSLFASYFTSELNDLKLVERSLTISDDELPDSSEEMSVD